MIILVHQYLLLRFLIYLFSIVLIGTKRGSEEISSDSESDGDKTPIADQGSDNDVTPNETLNDITDMNNTLKKVEQALTGKDINKEDLENIKEEYSSYFDEDSGNTEKEGLKEVKD